MKLSKGILAATAGLFAIGGAFADPNFDFIQTASTRVLAIPEQLECTIVSQPITCVFQFEGQLFPVFDAANPVTGQLINPKFERP